MYKSEMLRFCLRLECINEEKGQVKIKIYDRWSESVRI